MKADLDRIAEKSGLSVSEIIKACIRRSLSVIEAHVDKQLAATPQP
jgi:hypothetical protein